jgi:hemolysin type calcium-binding protein/WD40 repeat protein
VVSPRPLAGTAFKRYNVRVRRSLVLLAAACGSLCLLGPAQGAFPGTNGRIAYTCNSDQVCTANPDGSNPRAVISSGFDPVWSPNGQKLAFVTSGDLYTANADGTNPILFESTASEPSWSNDNATLAFLNSDGHIWLKSSTTQEQLTNGSGDADPAISPNGQKLAYDSVTGGHSHIFVITLGGSGIPTPTQLTTGSGDEENPTWSPDGSTILFAAFGSGLYKISCCAAGQTPAQVGTATDAESPSYSPDGSKIVYATTTGALVVTDSSGGNRSEIVNSFAAAADPDWGTAPLSSAAPPPPTDTADGPENTSYPVITEATGDSAPVVGHTLFASTGTWTGTFPITYTYQWKRCDGADPVNGPCVEIPGATGSSYTVTPADYQMRIRVAVSASNSDGRHTQNSEVTPIVTAIAPKNTATPPILPGGTNQVDQVLNVATGTWAGSSPIAFTYSWRRCDPVGDLETCVPIVGATSSSYTPTVADIGFSLRVWIVGANIAGSDTVITNHTFPIVDKPHFAPSAATAPGIAGVALPGRQLTADIGTFTGDAPISTTFHWYRCNAVGEDCHAIPSGTKLVYFPTSDDVGFTLRLFVSASNSYGTLLAKSDPTVDVAANPPRVKGRRIVGTAKGNYLAGGGHDDVIIGLAGNDTLLGGAGDDLLEGGAGNDVITGGAGADRIYGGPGSDWLDAADGERDIVDCGPGDDHAIVDSVDIVRNCESVETR